MIPLFTLIVKNILFLNCAKGLLFNIFKVFDGIGFKLVGGLVVTDDNAMLVHLEDADGPHMIDAALNGMVQRTGFFVAGNQNHNFFRVHNGSDTYGQDGCGHFADVVVKKAGIDLNGIFGQRLNPGAGAERGAGFVKCDVAVFSDAAEEKVYFSISFDGLFIGIAFFDVVFGHSVKHMDVSLGNINMLKEIFVHKMTIALRVSAVEADIFVHIEGDDIGKGELAFLVHFNQFTVCAERG